MMVIYERPSYWDGNVHEIGPLRIRYSGDNPQGEPVAECWINSEGGTAFYLDFWYAEAIAASIERFPDLFSATESDKGEPDEHGNRRGYLRLRVSQDKAKHGELAATEANEVYQVGRLVMNASAGQSVVPVDADTDKGRRNYRRSGLKLEGDWVAERSTRTEFIDKCICPRVERLDGRREADRLRHELFGRFYAADAYTGAPGFTTVEARYREEG